MKRKLLRKKQFGHRLTKYKRMGYTKKKVDVSQANRRKRNEQLQKKRDAKWLFTSMSRSTPKTLAPVNDPPSFESLSDLDGSYRQTQPSPPTSSPSSSSSSPENSSDDSTSNQDGLLTPSAAKLFPRPARLRPQVPQEVIQPDDNNINGRQVRNMLSLWQAQQRAADVANEVQQDTDDQANEEDVSTDTTTIPTKTNDDL